MNALPLICFFPSAISLNTNLTLSAMASSSSLGERVLASSSNDESIEKISSFLARDITEEISDVSSGVVQYGGPSDIHTGSWRRQGVAPIKVGAKCYRCCMIISLQVAIKVVRMNARDADKILRVGRFQNPCLVRGTNKVSLEIDP